MLEHDFRTSDDSTLSPLEVIFGPNIAYRDIQLGIMIQIIHEDFNAMRRTSSTFNFNLTSMDDQGRPLYPLAGLRNTCDFADDSPPTYLSCVCRSLLSVCLEPNTLKRCTRQPNEEGFAYPPVYGHEKEGGFVICETCHFAGKYDIPVDGYKDIYSALQDMTEKAQWALCLKCEYIKQCQYPDGAQLCDCFEVINRRVLCYYCLRQRMLYLSRVFKRGMNRRHHIWRDDLRNEINFEQRTSTLRPFCLECAANPSLPEIDGDQTRICMFCRKCNIIAAPRCGNFVEYLCRDWYRPSPRVQAAELQPPVDGVEANRDDQ